MDTVSTIDHKKVLSESERMRNIPGAYDISLNNEASFISSLSSNFLYLLYVSFLKLSTKTNNNQCENFLLAYNAVISLLFDDIGEQHSFLPPRPQDPTARKQRADNAQWGNALRDDFSGGGRGDSGGGGRGGGGGGRSGGRGGSSGGRSYSR